MRRWLCLAKLPMQLRWRLPLLTEHSPQQLRLLISRQQVRSYHSVTTHTTHTSHTTHTHLTPTHTHPHTHTHTHTHAHTHTHTHTHTCVTALSFLYILPLCVSSLFLPRYAVCAGKATEAETASQVIEPEVRKAEEADKIAAEAFAKLCALCGTCCLSSVGASPFFLHHCFHYSLVTACFVRVFPNVEKRDPHRDLVARARKACESATTSAKSAAAKADACGAQLSYVFPRVLRCLSFCVLIFSFPSLSYLM